MVRTLLLTPPMAKPRFLPDLGLFGGGLLLLLDGDLRDEVAHLANRRLGFFFARRPR